MNRDLYLQNPTVINLVLDTSNEKKTKLTSKPILEVMTRNKGKLREYKDLLPEFEIIGKDLDIPEIQSLDPYAVAEAKAKLAWEKNGHSPILIEDNSLDIMGLGGRPGTYVDAFCSEVEMRRMIAEVWLKDKDRRAIARSVIWIYDGKEFHTFEATIGGQIAETPRGTNGFGWDDIFIPDADPKKRTLAEMSEHEKNQISMRRKVIDKFRNKLIIYQYPIFMIPEPYESELIRLQPEKLNNRRAIKFAFSLESLFDGKKARNVPNKNFEAPYYTPVKMEHNKFFHRFNTNLESPSLGLILTDIDHSYIKQYPNNDPYLWQMGPLRRKLALAQRTEFFLDNQNPKIHKILNNIDLHGVPHRRNIRAATIEQALNVRYGSFYTNTHALKEIGYKKISGNKYVSRSVAMEFGLFNKIGRYGRSIFGIGSMPPVSGWRDVLVTCAIGHMPVFTHRNSLNAAYPERQIELIRQAKEVLSQIGLTEKAYQRAERNIGAAVGTGNVSNEIKQAKELYKKANVKLFRVYTINGDPRTIETAKALREELGDDIEIFVGQIADKTQALKLIDKDIRVDGLVFGHGGGMQCTSAINGMALTTLEEIYDAITDPIFNKTAIVAEGGVGTSVGALFVLGVDMILSNQKLVKGTIELSDIFFEHSQGGYCHPYHGSASAPTMLIESINEDLLEQRMSASGRAKKVEGKPGCMFFSEKANSMAFHINEYKHYAARTLTDLGVSSFAELREFLLHDSRELFRIISPEASIIAAPHETT